MFLFSQRVILADSFNEPFRTSSKETEKNYYGLILQQSKLALGQKRDEKKIHNSK